MNIHPIGNHFADQSGRRVMLHGINLSGSSKVPYTPDGSTYIRDGFFNHRHVSFVGRPFPLDQADEHFSRLREWGFNFLRFLITWEAIEHAGPGIYDQEYLDYITEVVKKAGAYGFNLFIDPHQDVWSRFTGGDGAPGWTLEAVGLDMTHFADTGAAIVHATHPPPYPKMIWSSNRSKLASATMFTLFFGGSDFAPLTTIDGQPVQDFLQRHYIDAVRQVAQRLCDLPYVLGYDTMNEPSSGYIGWRDLSLPGELLAIGDVPTPFQSMLLGEGFSQDVVVMDLGRLSIKHLGTRLMNQSHLRAWNHGRGCIWKQHGVWDIAADGQPSLIRPNYFYSRNDRPVDFTRDYYRPFANRFAQAIRQVHPQALIFLESDYDSPIQEWDEKDAVGIVYAPHWYDGYLVAKKEYSSMFGVNSRKQKVIFTPPAITRSYRRQLAEFKNPTHHPLAGIPVILGEFGIPFDLDEKRAFITGDFRTHVKALQRSFQAVEANLLDYTLWNYTPDNTNAYGDRWNDEDFSIFSLDQRTDPRDINSGGRALQAVIRPYPVATAGELLHARFDPFSRRFTMKFRSNSNHSAPTEIFVPNFHYPHGYSVHVSDGRYEIQRSTQILLYWPDDRRRVHKIVIHP